MLKESATTPPSDRISLLDPNVSPLRSETSGSLPRLLSELKISLLVSTYQAGLLAVIRAESPDELNTHFRKFPRPMGAAVQSESGRIAVGTGREVVEFHNMPAVCTKLAGPRPADACYLPRNSHLTGDIDVHEMAYGRDGLLFVNTRFSCLARLDAEHSFVPLWWPKFISSLGPEDRCHLNGLCLVDGQPKYVTALGQTNTAAGWRTNKARGGVLMDVTSGEIITSGLSMPHSPRWYDGRLWLLESGDGSIGTVDLQTGRYEEVAKLDGFTRGFSFHGPFAFIGLSQVRESAVFSGIPIADRLQERRCGVSVVDLRSGRAVGFLRFLDQVQEIFAVEVLPHRFPDLLEPADDLVGTSYSLSDEALRFVGSAEPTSTS